MLERSIIGGSAPIGQQIRASEGGVEWRSQERAGARCCMVEARRICSVLGAGVGRIRRSRMEEEGERVDAVRAEGEETPVRAAQ